MDFSFCGRPISSAAPTCLVPSGAAWRRASSLTGEQRCWRTTARRCCSTRRWMQRRAALRQARLAPVALGADAPCPAHRGAQVRSMREEAKKLRKDYDKTEDDLKALQSVGQIIGEAPRPQLNCAVHAPALADASSAAARRPFPPLRQPAPPRAPPSSDPAPSWRAHPGCADPPRRCCASSTPRGTSSRRRSHPPLS